LATAGVRSFFFFGFQVGPAHRRPDRLEFRRCRGVVVVDQVVDHLQVGLRLDPGLGAKRQAVLMDIADGDRQLLPEGPGTAEGDVVVVGQAITGEDIPGVLNAEGEVEDEPRVPLVG